MSAHYSKWYIRFLAVVSLLFWCAGIFSAVIAGPTTSAEKPKKDIVITIIHGKLVRLNPKSGKTMGPIKSIKVDLDNRLIFTKTLREDPSAHIGNLQLASYLDDFIVELPDPFEEGGVWYNGDVDYAIGQDAETWRVLKPCTVTMKITHETPVYLPMSREISMFINVKSDVKAPPYAYDPAQDTSYLWVAVLGRSGEECQAIMQALKSTYGDRVFCAPTFGEANGKHEPGEIPIVNVYGGMEQAYTIDSKQELVTPEIAVAFIGDVLRKKDNLYPPKPQAPEKISASVYVDRKEQAEPIIAKLKEVFGEQMHLTAEVQASDNDTRQFPAISIWQPESAYAYIDSKSEPLTPDRAVVFMKELIKKNGLFHPVFTDAKSK